MNDKQITVLVEATENFYNVICKDDKKEDLKKIIKKAALHSFGLFGALDFKHAIENLSKGNKRDLKEFYRQHWKKIPLFLDELIKSFNSKLNIKRYSEILAKLQKIKKSMEEKPKKPAVIKLAAK